MMSSPRQPEPADLTTSPLWRWRAWRRSTPAAERAPSVDEARPEIGIAFAGLWALALATHVWNQGSDRFLGANAVTDRWYWLVLVAVAIVLYRPQSGRRLLTLAAVSLLAVLAQMPFTANHWLLVGFVSAGILVSGWGLRHQTPITAAAVVAHSAPYLRLALLLGYSAAAFSKLNHTFLDPSHSCATGFMQDVMGFWGLPAHMASDNVLVPTAVAAIEVAIPVLLVVPRTRAVGVMLAATFHLAMGSTPRVPVLDFAGILIALLVLFVPDAVISELRRLHDGFRLHIPTILPLLRAPLTRIVALTALVLAVGLRGRIVPEAYWPGLSWMILLATWTVVVGLLVWSLARNSRSRAPRSPLSFRTASRAQWALVALLLLVAASPYLGLRTQSAFTMFSNLRTEQGSSNHLLIRGVGPFRLQHDYVRVLHAQDEELASAAADRDLVHDVEFRRRMSAQPDQPVVFLDDDQIVSLDQARNRPDLVQIGYWEAKLLRFRPLAAEGVQPCRH